MQGKLRGWAMVIDQPKLKAKVHLHVDGERVQSVTAGNLRKDLLDAGIGDGHHGFEISLGPTVKPGSTIEVIAGNANYVLPNSGKKAGAYGLA